MLDPGNRVKKNQKMEKETNHIRVIATHARAKFEKIDPDFKGIGSRRGFGFWWNNYA